MIVLEDCLRDHCILSEEMLPLQLDLSDQILNNGGLGAAG